MKKYVLLLLTLSAIGLRSATAQFTFTVTVNVICTSGWYITAEAHDPGTNPCTTVDAQTITVTTTGNHNISLVAGTEAKLLRAVPIGSSSDAASDTGSSGCTNPDSPTDNCTAFTNFTVTLDPGGSTGSIN
jgi:hypothetical protein